MLKSLPFSVYPSFSFFRSCTTVFWAGCGLPAVWTLWLSSAFLACMKLRVNWKIPLSTSPTTCPCVHFRYVCFAAGSCCGRTESNRQTHNLPACHRLNSTKPSVPCFLGIILIRGSRLRRKRQRPLQCSQIGSNDAPIELHQLFGKGFIRTRMIGVKERFFFVSALEAETLIAFAASA